MSEDGKTDSQDPLNLSELNELYGKETVTELLQMTVDEAVGLIRDIRNGANSRDCSVIMASAHQLKGLALTMTINNLSKISLELETAAREHNWDAIAPAQTRLEAEFDKVSAYIKQLLAGG